MSPTPGWYPDPAATETQRYWDGEQWVGVALPADAQPPGSPPASPTPVAVLSAPAVPVAPTALAEANATMGAAGPPASATPRTDASAGGDQAGGSDQAPVTTGPSVPVKMPGTTTTLMLDVGKLAPLGLRAAARGIDIALVLGLNIVVNGYFFVRYIQLTQPAIQKALDAGSANPFAIALPDQANSLAIVMVVVAMALWLAYEVPATANSGQTVGKRLVGIRVRRMDDSALTFGQSLRRWLILALPSPLVSSLCGLPLQLADLLWCLWDRPARQCIHDKAVATIVVRADRPAPTRPSL